MSAAAFPVALKSAARLTSELIEDQIAGVPGNVANAMVYATRGGKGMRAFLVLEGARVCGVDADHALPAAAAIECIHAYSLVHDDLPAMDDDELRRGQPTVHVKWDEATAILTGDALQSLAFGLLSDAPLPADVRLLLIRSLANAAGVRGMVGGQELDIGAESAAEPLDLDQITRLQAAKTGALISWSATAGPLMAGTDTAPLATYGQAIGLAFQIADDIIDVTGDTATVGKATGKDAGARKATFVSSLGLDGARERARALVDEAKAAMEPYGPDADTLRAAAEFVVARDR